MPESVEDLEQIGAPLGQLEQFLSEGQEPAMALQTAARSLFAASLSSVSPIVSSQLPPPAGMEPARFTLSRTQVPIEPNQPLAGLNPFFQWGLEYGLCVLTPNRDWYPAILQKADEGLDAGQRDVRARGYEAFRSRRWNDAFRILTGFAQHHGEDAFVWRLIGFLALRGQRWDQARSAYALAARLTEKIAPTFAIECHLAASFAARHLGEWELALNHSIQAGRQATDPAFCQYEQAVAGFRLSLTQQLLVPHSAHQTMMEASSVLRKVLRQDCRYAVRMECDANFDRVRDHVQVLLQELHAEMAREASGALALIRTSIVNAEYDCTPERFGAIAAQPLETGRLLSEIYARNSILDFADVIRQAPPIQTQLQTIRTLIRRVDERMQETQVAFNMARQVVSADNWSRLGAGLEERMKQLRQLHSARDLDSYQALEKEAPAARIAFYRFAAIRLKAMRVQVTQSLAMARSMSQRLNQKASTCAAQAAKPPFRMEGGFLIWLTGFFILRTGLPQTVSIPPTVLTVLSAVISLAAVIFVHRFSARQRMARAHATRRQAALHDRSMYQPLSQLLAQINDCMELCSRERSFTLPAAARGYIGDKGTSK